MPTMTRLPPVQAKAQFLKWIRMYHPELFERVTEAPTALSGILDSINKVFDTVSNTIVKVGGAYVQGRAALDLVKANIKRAKMGLGPVNSLEDANMLDMQGSGGGMFSSIPPVVLYVGLGVIAYFIFRKLR